MAFTTKLMLDGKRHRVVVLYGKATTTTGENGVIKVDRSAITGPDGVGAPDYLAVEEITASVQGFESVQLFWEHSGGDEIIAELSGESYYDFVSNGALYPGTAPGAVTDGDIKLTTNSAGTDGAAVAGDSYFIMLKLRKA